MIQLHKNCFVVIMLMLSCSVYGMQPAKKQIMPYSYAILKADMTGRTDWLEAIVKEGVGLNTVCENTGLLPLHDFIRSRYGSHLVTIGICNGARTDVQTRNDDTLFHCMARCPKIGQPKEHSYFPKQNLLSALALPTYQYPEDEKKGEEGLVELTPEQKLANAKATVTTFLLCLKRREACALTPVKWCILAQLPKYVYCSKLFSLVLPQMRHPERCIVQFPFAWFGAVAQRLSGDDREKFLKFFAPMFAQYRLEQAQKVLQVTNHQSLTAYQVAQDAVEFLKSKKYPIATIQDARKMVEALESEGFVDRHMPLCTSLLENMLLGKEPFDGVRIE